MELELPRTARAAASNDAAAVEHELEDELSEHVFDLVDETWCESGGWPEDEEFRIDACRVSDGGVAATIVVLFSEQVPSACKDSPYSEPRQRTLRLSLPKDATVARLEPDECGDLSDRNSAADGW
jgi:hypothetical protein